LNEDDEFLIVSPTEIAKNRRDIVILSSLLIAS